MTTSGKEIPTDLHAPGTVAILSSATLATVQDFVAQARPTAAPAAAKTLLVVGGEAATAQLAATIAGDLKRTLVRVPLSAVVSKYIGETEKNLDRVFDAASKSGAILFFDEADALFGKRSDVKDSHDRYADAAGDGLLQRIESHAGIAIMAARWRPNLDSPFIRRLRAIAVVDLPH